tara:strand:+ start:277 stop:1050 length:774 start_codon:yes stop_codon:yes gene_type:complete
LNYLEKLFSLKGKISIVTGAARGNGFAISEALAIAGSKVLMVDILHEELYGSCEVLKDKDLDVDCYSFDITDYSALSGFVKDLKYKYGKIDILVNNAGISLGSKIENYDFSDWIKTFDVNVNSPFVMTKEFLPLMKERGGSIINITSLNSELAFPDNPAYVASKGALKQLTKSFALDLAKYNIRANNVGPGYFATNMTQKSYKDTEKREKRENKTMLGRWGHPEDLAGVIIFLSSPAAEYITGQDIYVDGGWLAKGL